MPIARFEMPDGRIARFEVPEGTTPEQAQAAISQQLAKAPAAPAKSKQFGEQLNDFVADAPRQVGLTARHAIEGVGGAFDALVGNPLRTLAAPMLGNRPTADTGGTLADAAGLPKPQTSGERVVGDAARTLAGGLLPIGAGAALAKGATGVAQGVGRALAAKPAMQLASAAAAGTAGGYTRETGGDAKSQLLASIVAGVGAPMAAGAAGRAAGAAKRAVAGRPVPPPQQIEITINNALQPSGLSLASLPSDVAATIRRDVQEAFKLSDNLTPDAVRRLADYRLTGTTPTAARLSLDPGEITRQENLMKLAANSRDLAAQDLVQTKNANNRQLTTGLNGLGANTADDAYAAGEQITGALGAYDQRARGVIGKLYDRARDNSGRSAQLDPSAFTQRAGNLLNESNAESFLPPDIRNKLNAFATGQTPLTVDIAEQFKTSIGRLQRNASDGNMRHALGVVRQALDETPLQQGQEVGASAMSAFDRARRVNRQYMQIVEKTPALQAVRDRIEPDKFVAQFIVGGGSKSNVMDVARLKTAVAKDPEALTAIKTQIAAHLKNKALSNAADETGNFSQSAYNNALKAIGDRKLRMFFQPDEIAQLKAIGRVASYEQVQPAGSAVNNSNSAGAIGGILERIANSSLISKIPLGVGMVREPVQNIVIGQQSGRALDAPRALVAPMLPVARARALPVLSPAALMGGESEEQRKRRQAGLLLP
ncbi:hypothetical protein OU994_18015 [Pseudoduganella sp. SL102]|uniref:hypothetical protein n=1 Tax=Pseudoduganella sp. SL102 TaxID=2995154 RepID=UPI00248C3FD4|nr:hypothetical protein [Pseudoduganella sp. SL102]WBS00217.1 hypothetical protein OU994_18015 [Pseudoduganella sp. SL102]